MFETCEWNDEGAVRAPSPVTTEKGKMSSAQEKGTNSRKKRLKRNRQLLEVLHTLNTPSTLHPDVTPPPGASPPKRQKKTRTDMTSTVLCPPEDAPGAERPPEPGERLSRRQWRNKLKNKRRNQNKFKVAAAQEEPPRNQEDGKMKSQQFQGKRNGATSEEGGEEESPSAPGSAARRPQVPKTKRLRAGEGRTSGDAACGRRGGDDLAPQQVTHREKARLQKLKKMMQREAKGKTTGTPSQEDPHGTMNDTEQPAADNSEAGRDQSVELRSRMEQRLNSARFRYINQQLYTSDSRDALLLFEQDPEAFTIYHSGFSQQVQRWPVNPITQIIKYIKNRPSSLVVADFGCGDALLARSIRNKVHSFDLVALNDRVTVCDMAKVPLQDGSVDVAVFCLSLMGKNLGDFLREANRVLKTDGVLLVAEVSSRFGEVRPFLAAMSQLGFKSINKNTENSYFFLFEFNKTGCGRDASKHPGLQLKPCLYKKR